MLKCKQVAERASEYLDDNKMGWLERCSWCLHLMMCANCRRFIKQLKLVRDMSEGRESDPASEQELNAVMDKVCRDCSDKSK